EEKIRALLGDSGYKDYLALEEQRTLKAAREILFYTGCVGYLIDVGTPLTTDQLNGLAAIYRRLEEEGRFASGDEPDPQTGLLPGHHAVLIRAAGLLRPDQLAALRAFYEYLYRR